jgi:hypothetical protein
MYLLSVLGIVVFALIISVGTFLMCKLIIKIGDKDDNGIQDTEQSTDIFSKGARR